MRKVVHVLRKIWKFIEEKREKNEKEKEENKVSLIIEIIDFFSYRLKRIGKKLENRIHQIEDLHTRRRWDWHTVFGGLMSELHHGGWTYSVRGLGLELLLGGWTFSGGRKLWLSYKFMADMWLVNTMTSRSTKKMSTWWLHWLVRVVKKFLV